VTDCYIAAILEPADELQGCLAQTAADASVDALVRLHVRWFLIKRRSAGDPVGTAVYRRLCRCLRRLLDAATVSARGLRDGRRLGPATVVTSPGREAGSLLGYCELEGLVAGLPEWRAALDLVGCPRRDTRLPGLLAAAVRATLRAGGGFHFQDLVEAVQAAARLRVWAALRREAAATAVAWPTDPDALFDCYRTEPRTDGYTWQEELETTIERVQAVLPDGGRTDAALNLRRVFQATIPYLRAGEWPSARELAQALSGAGLRVGKSSVAVHLQTVKDLWKRVSHGPN
jgi:hypothetical protein